METENKNPSHTPTVECGLFGISDDHLESFQSLDERFVKNRKSTYFFEARGESMSPLIFPGDVLVVDRSLKPAKNRLAIVIHEGEMICKRLGQDKNGWLLLSENPKFPARRVDPEEGLIVWGIVRAVVHPLIEKEEGLARL